MTNQRIIDRLKKVLALAQGGDGGEKENAERQLHALLRKHGLTMADIDDASIEKVKCEFKFSNDYEAKLIVQICAVVLDTSNPDMYGYKGTRSRIHTYCTPSQKAQAIFMYEVLRKALKQELFIATSAFIMAQSLYRESSSESTTELTEDELRQYKKVQAMSRSMDKVATKAALENKD